MRSQGWRACIAPAIFWSVQHGEWVSTKQTARSKGSAGVMVVVWRHRTVVLATGASSCARGVCSRSFTVHRSRSQITGKSSVRLASGSPPRPCRSSLEATSRWSLSGRRMGARRRWLRGGAAARKGRVIGFFIVARDLAGACEAATHISPSTLHLTGPLESSLPRG